MNILLSDPCQPVLIRSGGKSVPRRYASGHLPQCGDVIISGKKSFFWVARMARVREDKTG